MKKLKNFINTNKKAQRYLGSFVLTCLIIGVAEFIGGLIVLNVPIILLFLVLFVGNYFLHKDFKVEI